MSKIEEGTAPEPVEVKNETETLETEIQEEEVSPDLEPEEDPEEEEQAEETTEETPDLPADKAEFFELLKETYPSQSFDSEEDYIKAANQYMKDNLEANRVIGEVFELHPELSEIIRDMAKGASFLEALARNVELDAIEPQPGDPDYKKWKEAKAEREERKRKAQEVVKEQEKARKESFENIEKFRTDKGMTPEERDQFATTIAKILDKVVIEGRVDADFLELMYKGLAYDQSIETARKQGEIRGKNEAIVEKKARRATPGDGLPLITPQQAPEPAKPKENPIAKQIVKWGQNRQKF